MQTLTHFLSVSSINHRQQNFALTLFPFALLFQTLTGLTKESIRNYAIASTAEIIVISVLAVIILKVRRAFE